MAPFFSRNIKYFTILGEVPQILGHKYCGEVELPQERLIYLYDFLAYLSFST